MKKLSAGLSLLEILIVTAIFAILAILTSRAVLLTLRGSRKSEATTRVRENLDYSLAVMERNLRNAESVDCPGSTATAIYYQDENAKTASFSCINTGGPDSYIASSSARLTNEKVEITSCTFTCDDSTSPPSVTISIGARDANTVGVEGALVTATTQIFLRTY